MSSFLFFAVLMVVVCGVSGDGAESATSKMYWNYTALFDRVLQVYRKNMENSSDRKIILDDFKFKYDTQLTHLPKGDVEMINGTLRDLYFLVRKV